MLRSVCQHKTMSPDSNWRNPAAQSLKQIRGEMYKLRREAFRTRRAGVPDREGAPAAAFFPGPVDRRFSLHNT